jgi:RHS repeat-associated protein
MGSTSTAHASGNTVIQNWTYTFDEVGNLLTRGRSDAVNPATTAETFTYDQVNRVLTSQVTTSAGYNATDSYAYDALGNLTQKSGNAYTYGAGCTAGSRAAGPHAVCTVAGGTQFSYDGNGNLVSGNNRTISYNSMNKTVEIQSDAPSPTATVDFIYGGDGNRVVQSATSAGTTARTVYVGLGATGKSLYERTSTTIGHNTTTEHVNFIYAGGAHGGNAFALRVLADDGTATATKYYNFDHLGSVTAMSDEEGHVVSDATGGANATVFGYDPWGARRKPDGEATTTSFALQTGHREFTGHEAIPDVGLINMNGRVYDPVLGRFLSPDPNVQFASDLQSYNRYSYVQNNPLKYTDPTGYFLGFHNNFASWLSIGESVLSLGICAATGGTGCLIVGLQMTLLNITASVAAGASFDQTIAVAAIGAAVGFVSGAAVGAAGGGPLAAVVGGALSGAASTAIASLVTKQSLGWNLLDSAAIGAASAAAGWGLQKLAPASQASVPAPRDDETSGENVEEVRAREQAAGAAANDPRNAPPNMTTDYGTPQSQRTMIADNYDGAEGHSGSKSDAAPIYDPLPQSGEGESTPRIGEQLEKAGEEAEGAEHLGSFAASHVAAPASEALETLSHAFGVAGTIIDLGAGGVDIAQGVTANNSQLITNGALTIGGTIGGLIIGGVPGFVFGLLIGGLAQ